MNEETAEQCRSFIAEAGVYGPCRDGFPQTGSCAGLAGVPICMVPEITGRLYPFTGEPFMELAVRGK